MPSSPGHTKYISMFYDLRWLNELSGWEGASTRRRDPELGSLSIQFSVLRCWQRICQSPCGPLPFRGLLQQSTPAFSSMTKKDVLHDGNLLTIVTWHMIIYR